VSAATSEAGAGLGKAIPRLASLDLARSLAFFEKQLGFSTRHLADHRYGMAVRGDVEIHFWACDDAEIARNTSCYVRVTDVYALHAEFALTLPELGPVQDRPWGMAELHVFDPDGNLVTFGQEIG